MSRSSKKSAIALLAAIPLVATLVLSLPWLAERFAEWGIARLLRTSFGATVDIEQVQLSWWPLVVDLRGVDVVHPRVHAVHLSHVRADIETMPLFRGVLLIPAMRIDGVQIGRRSPASNAPVSEAGARDFIFPDVQPLPLSTLIDTQRQHYEAQVGAFRLVLKEKQARWAGLLNDLPNPAVLAAHEQRLKGRQRAALALTVTDDPVLLLESDLARFAQVDDALRRDWQGIQNQYLGLKALAEQSVERIFQERGLTDAQLKVLGQRLIQETLGEWFARGLGFHQVLAAHTEATVTANPEPPELSLLIKKTEFGGVFEHGARLGQIRGEMLNLSNAPVRLAEPLTLHLEAQGKALGTMQLTALLDHRSPGREADHFNFSLQKTRFPRFVLASNPVLAIDLHKAVLSVDMAGTIRHEGTLDLSLSSVFNTQSIDVRAKSSDHPMVGALAQSLAPVRELTIAGAVKGTLDRPELHATTTLNDWVAPVAKAVVDGELGGQKAQLREQLEAELQRQLVGLEQDLAHSSALLDVARQRAEPFRRLRNAVNL